MPRGTCHICGCTDGHACEGGCHWVDREHEYCSQCVRWALPVPPDPYPGVFPHGLVPVRGPRATPGDPLGPWAWLVDDRRLTQEQVHALAFGAAAMGGHLAGECLEELAAGTGGLCLAPQFVRVMISAPTLERAAALLAAHAPADVPLAGGPRRG